MVLWFNRYLNPILSYQFRVLAVPRAQLNHWDDQQVTRCTCLSECLHAVSPLAPPVLSLLTRVILPSQVFLRASSVERMVHLNCPKVPLHRLVWGATSNRPSSRAATFATTFASFKIELSHNPLPPSLSSFTREVSVSLPSF